MGKERGSAVIVRLDSEEERRKVIEGKGKLKGNKVCIMEDLTWREKRKRWLIRKIAEEKSRGNRVREGSDDVTIKWQ